MANNDWVLIIWIVCTVLWDFAVFGATTYLVFWREQSGWWFILAVLLTAQITLFKVLAKRYGVPYELETDDRKTMEGM